MPFSDAIAQFAYWRKDPPLHLMVKAYLGIKEEEPEEMNPVEVAQAVRMLTGSSRAPKLDQAPSVDRERFEQLKWQMNG